MMPKNKLSVSVGSDVINDQMTVFIHDNDIPLIIGTIKDDKTVVFRPPKEMKMYTFDEVKTVMLKFIKRMEEMKNI